MVQAINYGTTTLYLCSIIIYVPCRYAHYDNNPSFSDFQQFGGWSHPGIKQYAGDATVCGKGIGNTV